MLQPEAMFGEVGKGQKNVKQAIEGRFLSVKLDRRSHTDKRGIPPPLLSPGQGAPSQPVGVALFLLPPPFFTSASSASTSCRGGGEGVNQEDVENERGESMEIHAQIKTSVQNVCT